MKSKTFWKQKERNEMFCSYCGRPVSKNVHREADNFATIDHVYPRAKGGTSRSDNLAVACRPCNLRKGDKVDFNPARPKYPKKNWRHRPQVQVIKVRSGVE